jgi:hypothetical protein
VQPGTDTAVLIHLLGLGSEDLGLLVQLAGNGLVLSNDALANRLVNRVNESDKAAGDALLFCSDSASFLMRRARCPGSRSSSIARWTMWSPMT